MRRIPGDGPSPCPLFFIGEAPGAQEEKAGKPFVPRAPAGSEFKRHHEAINLYRQHIYVTNLVKYHIPGDKDPTAEMIARDEPELLRELREVNPKIVVTLGAISTRYFLGKRGLDAIHGIPHPLEINGQSFTCLPCYHPAAGLYSPDMQAFITYDFQQLSLLIRKKIEPRPVRDAYPEPQYILLKPEMSLGGPTTTVGLFRLMMDSTECAVDTEGIKGQPWGLSVSSLPGHAEVIREGLPLEEFRMILAAKPELKIILHNALHDLPVLRDLGINVTNFTDTMLKAYLLCLEPQGLKSLVYRHCGMEMSSYDEITRDASQSIALQYLIEAARHEWPPAQETVVFDEDGTPKLKRPWSVNKRIDRILNDFSKQDTDARSRWHKVKEDLREPVELQLGIMPQATLDDIPQRIAVPYSGRDADGTGRLDPILDEKIVAMGLERVLKIDLDVIPMVEQMQSVGMLADKEYFERFGRELGHEMTELTEQIHTVGGLEINPGSDDQVAHLLFHHIGLESFRTTKSGKREQVDIKVVESLRPKHPVVPLILDFKERKKLKSTYADKLPLWVEEDGRIRANFRITRVPSGRLACSEPNLLAQPVRTELGRRIREGFIAPEGKLLGSWDLNQIEMRVMAHESEDANLMTVLTDPDSPGIHIDTCVKIHGVLAPDMEDADAVKAFKETTEYMMIKNVTFGIIYFISAYGLTAQMHQRGFPDWGDADSQVMIDEWFKLYPGVRSYMENRKAEARRYGFVRDMFGRIRYLEGVHSNIRRVRHEAYRRAINHPIQAGAQGVIKIGMAKIWKEVLPLFWADGKGSDGLETVEPLLQVHDEIVFEFWKGLEQTLDPLIQNCLCSAAKLRVPITASGAWGPNWKTLK